MTSKEKEQLLIDYAEGMLSAEEKKRAEHLLRESPQLQNDFGAIKNVFTQLQHLPSETVPENYFSNFLPRLRNRIDSREYESKWILPRWFEAVLTPGVTVFVILFFGIMYQIFQPQKTQSPIYSVMQEIDQNDLNNIVEEYGKYEIINSSIQNAEQLFDRFTSTDELSRKIDSELLSVELLASHMGSEWVEVLEEPEIDLVLNRLSEPEIQ